ncbi:MAG: hypothetical protein H6581_09050 [Bacteroidia bacterium]|nr:hypothetical protein [Bacteroidia bacterium]
MEKQEQRKWFLRLSEALTGYGQFQLEGTGNVDDFLATLEEIVKPDITNRLLLEFSKLWENDKDGNTLEAGIRNHLMTDPLLGPVARNLIKLWYLGSWYQLPALWRENFGSHAGDYDHVISPRSYVEGLVWDAIKAHPQGAKQPGFGTWAFPPEVD